MVLVDGHVHVHECFDVAGLFDAAAANFAAAARALRPGGRLALADIVSAKQLPDGVTCDASLWAACIGGAMELGIIQG